MGLVNVLERTWWESVGEKARGKRKELERECVVACACLFVLLCVFSKSL